MQFNAYTSVKVENEENENIPNYRFFFTELEQLEERYDKTVYTIDVIGKLILAKAPEIVRKRNDEDAVKTDVIIENERGTQVKISLWGDTGNPIQKIKEGENVVLIVTGLTVDKFADDYFLKISKSTTVYVDLDIPQVQEFKSKFADSTKVIIVDSNENSMGG